jgi:hypothetical protein
MSVLDTDKILSDAVWPADAAITMVNVNWNNDYRDVVRFKDRATLDKYIDGRPNRTLKNMQAMPVMRPIRINVAYNKASKFNYVRVSAGSFSARSHDDPKSYYYFIRDVAYLAPDVTQLTVQLDIWQTYIYDVKMGNCYIERGHIGIANANNFSNYGRDYLTIPEGLDVGGEYQIVKTARDKVMDPLINGGYSVLVSATVDLTVDPGDKDNPKLQTAPGGSVDGIPSGASFYVLPTGDDFRALMRYYSDKPWVSQGIISITIIPDVKRFAPDGVQLDDKSPSNTFKMYPYPGMLSQPYYKKLATAWRDDAGLNNVIPQRYRRLRKFFTYPYMVIELTTWSGSPLIIRPEAWASDDAELREQAFFMPPGQRIVFMPFRYNAHPATAANSHNAANDDYAEYLDFAVTLSNFPTLPIVNNQAIAFLANNKNSLQWQNASADWSQQRAMNSARVGYDQASSGIGLNSQLTGISTSASQQQADLNSVLSIGQVAQGAIGGSQAGPVGIGVGAGVGAVSAATDIARQQIGTGISNDAARRATGARNDNAGYLRDTNRSLAEYSARGDYENQVAGINAKVQDARLSQPSVSGQFGGDAMNLAHFNSEVSARWKLLDPASMTVVGEYWLRYGYAVRKFGRIPDNFMCMEKFTYWKLSETYLVAGPMPESHKQALRGIFEKGVTVWANPDDIGNIDIANNAPLAGITY